MCGRFKIDADLRDIEKFYSIADNELYLLDAKTEVDIFPTDNSIVIINHDGHNTARKMSWGFESYGIKRPIINARVETLMEKRMFASRMQSGRCTIPATAFYEWERSDSGEKIKHTFAAHDHEIISFAGLYAIDRAGHMRFTIITCEASGDVARIHSRMPLALGPSHFGTWIDPEVQSTEAYLLLKNSSVVYEMIS